MKKLYTFLAVASILISSVLQAQTIWTGPTMTFSKTGGADWTLEENQDRITSNVWITRANTQGIFNIVTEESYTDFSSPADTEWAFGTTADIGSLTFDNWEDTHGSNPPSIVGEEMVLHLITDDIYIDITFTAWGSGQDGAQGSFSYERSTDQTIGVNENQQNEDVTVYPNPSATSVHFNGLDNAENFVIYDITGSIIQKGTAANNGEVDIHTLQKGVYFVRFENGTAVRFMKK
ncbi:T9SS type A sorting domain-containing protein [Halocola ammonii]